MHTIRGPGGGSRRGRARVYDAGATRQASSPLPGGVDEQGDHMRAEPYLTPDLNRTDAWHGVSTGSSSTQYGAHGEGAETIGNSARGMLSGGLAGATTTRGGQQGGIGASVYDPEPSAPDGGREDPSAIREQDLTLGEQYGGTMEAPRKGR